MITTLDILSTRKVTNIYKEELRFAINKDFFSAFNTFNPPHQKLAKGYRLFLNDGERVDVSDNFQVEVYEAADFKRGF
tara:strand:+ start:326 stop:559 length:234 start_codon:yes stop_codon:yes gene_type:complete